MLKNFFFIVISFFLFITSISSQEIPPINTFTTEDYGAENQNWAISQASNKYIYAANNKGLLEFNGEDWTLYPTPDETIMRSVKCFEEKIFTGSYTDFGFWKKNDFGLLEYTSIVKNNSIEMLEDEQIWEISELDGWMIFKSLQRIYIYNLKSKNLKVINAKNNITKISKVENAIYFQEFGRGIFVIENGIPKLVSDNPILKNNRIIDIFLKDNKLTFLTQKSGFYFLENGNVKKWNIEADKILFNKTIYSSKKLKNNNIVLGTISNGFIKISKTGEVIYKITQGLGLSNNTVLSVFEDVENNIWLGLDNGINTINLKSPFKLFVKKTNYWGTIYASNVYKGDLYLGTNQGLYYKKLNSEENFKFIDNTQGQVWDLQNIDGTLFCTHDSGTFIIKDKKANLISNIEGAWNLQKIDNTTLLQGNYNGLFILKKKNGTWFLDRKIKGFSNSSRYFLLMGKNRVFVNHEYKGVFKLQLDENFEEVLKVEKDESVERGIHSSLIAYKDDVLYSCKKGVYKYNFEKDSFEKDSVYSKLMVEDEFLSAKLIYDKHSNKLWSFTADGIRFLTPGKLSDVPELQIIPIRGALHKGASGFENIINLKNKTYLIGTSNGYLTVDLNAIKEPKDFNVSINKVYSFQLDDKENNVSIINDNEFDYKFNNLKFSYSVPHFSKTASVKYQYILEGFNEKWSKKEDSNSFLFENLPSGDYTFKVKAFIDKKESSNIASYSFLIKNPWYLTTFFKILYVIIILLILTSLHFISRRYYKKQREKLLDKKQKELELKELENSQKIIKLNNDKLRNDIESKNRELATSTMSIIKKNEFLSSIKNELVSGGTNSVNKVVKIIDKNLNNADDWKMFQEAFNNADKNFIKKIKGKHPELTPNDLRLCAYLRLNLSSKEIAPLLNISPRSVEVKRYRLRKKMQLEHDKNLTDYIINI